MQNKANFPKSQMNVNKEMARKYEKKDTWWSGKNKAKTKPNKANLLNAQMNVNKVSTKDYERMSNWALCENKANFNPKQTQTNPIYRGVASGEAGYEPNTPARYAMQDTRGGR